MKKSLFLLSLLPIVLSSCGASHVHIYGQELKYDDEFHWNECTCGDKSNIVSHNYDEPEIVKPATCLEDGKQKLKCKTCDYSKEVIIPASHTFASEWSFDETGHWHAATCEHTDQKADFAQHDLIENTATHIMECKVCDYTLDLVTLLDTPTNLKVENGIFSFSPVANALEYLFRLTSDGVELISTSLEVTSYDLSYLPGGEYSIYLKAKRNGLVSNEVTLNFEVECVDNDVLFEAEKCLLNLNNYSVDSQANGEAYSLGFDDCGQGIYVRYYSFFEGQHDMSIAYSTAIPGSYMNVYVNGVKGPKAVFNTNTNWFGDSKTTDDVTVSVALNKGWNHIYLIKDGTSSDNPAYGGYVQLDYVIIKGSKQSYSLTEHPDYNKVSYYVETECTNWHWANKNQRPSNWGNKFSMNYGLGEINTDGDGFKVDLFVEQSGRYKVQVAYGCDIKSLPVKVSVNNGEGKAINLDAQTNGWDNIALSSGFEVTLTGNEFNSIDFLRNGHWWTPDYLLISKIS